jgi:hypothetical protein
VVSGLSVTSSKKAPKGTANSSNVRVREDVCMYVCVCMCVCVCVCGGKEKGVNVES